MKFATPQTIEGIARILNCEYIGNAEFPVFGMNEIHVVASGDIVFVDHPKYYDKALTSKATIILINKKVDCPDGKSLLISDDPFRDFNILTNYFNPFIAATSTISKTAIIGENTILQPNVFVGNNVKIGNDCLIHSNVCIYDNTVIGNNVTIHSGAILGADAFYYKNRPEGFDQLLSVGRVVVKDNVHIGASCTIDKGVTGDTTIGKGTKIDNQVQIGHDTVVGENCLIADTPDLFTQSIEWLLTDRTLRANMSRQALDLVKSKYSLEIELSGFEKIITSVVEGHMYEKDSLGSI